MIVGSLLYDCWTSVIWLLGHCYMTSFIRHLLLAVGFSGWSGNTMPNVF